MMRADIITYHLENKPYIIIIIIIKFVGYWGSYAPKKLKWFIERNTISFHNAISPWDIFHNVVSAIWVFHIVEITIQTFHYAERMV